MNLRNGFCILGLLTLSMLLSHSLLAASLLGFPHSLWMIIIVVFPSLEWPPNHLLVSLVWGNFSEPYVTHTNFIIVGQQEESSFQQFFGTLILENWSICSLYTLPTRQHPPPKKSCACLKTVTRKISFWETIIHWYFLIYLFSFSLFLQPIPVFFKQLSLYCKYHLKSLRNISISHSVLY